MTAAAVGEHPQLLFRKQDIPYLQEKITTPLGERLWARICAAEKDPVALGMRFVLEGDASYVSQAWPLLEKKMADESPGAFNGSDGAYAHRVGQVAMAFDLLYDGLTTAQRSQVEAYFAARVERMLYKPNTITEKVNWSPNSNYSGHLNGASGLAGLNIIDKPGPAPQAPRSLEKAQRSIAPQEFPGHSAEEMVPGVMPQ